MNEVSSIQTRRLRIVPVTVHTLDAELRGGAMELGSALGVAVAPDWPAEYWDADAIRYTMNRLINLPDERGWWAWHVIRAAEAGGHELLIGGCGYKGPPDSNGVVEIGYGVVVSQRRNGYATEASQGLIDRAFALPHVRMVAAETLPELEPSIGVMRKLGMMPMGSGLEAGTIRYSLTRDAWNAGRLMYDRGDARRLDSDGV